MKFILSFIIVIAGCFSVAAQEDLESDFYNGLEKVEARYRAGKAKALAKADRVVVYLVQFDGLSGKRVFADSENNILIAPYEKQTRILRARELGAEDRKRLLGVVSRQIAKPNHSGGAFCHYPVHGIRAYAGDELIHEGTFCWLCGNFSFSYPQGAGWLDTNAELEKIFNELMPVPEEELERFQKKYSRKKK